MKPSPDQERLLADVLRDGADAGFRETLLGETLRLASRRRQWRKVRRGLAALSVLGLAAMGAWWAWPEKAKPGLTPGCPVVRTQPLPAAAIVVSRPLAPDQLVASIASADIVLTVSGGFREIDDDELLALAAPQVAALVRRGPHEAELIFVQPNPPPEQSN